MIKKLLIFTLTFWCCYFAYAGWELIFYGAVGGEVAGSCYVLTNGTDAILIDCGSHVEGEIEIGGTRTNIRDFDPFDFCVDKIRAVLITHAHDDHIGRLAYLLAHPSLANRNPPVPVYMTEVTKQLYLSKNEDDDENKITLGDCVKQFVRKNVISVNYNVVFSLVPGVSAFFVDTSHIPGSAGIVVYVEEGEEVLTLMFSGDVGPGDHPFLHPLSYEFFSRVPVDILVVESTYGATVRSYADKEADLQRFYAVIREAKEQNKIVIIPAFAMDRTQRVLTTLIDGIHQGVLPPLRIAIGGKSSCAITEAYKRLAQSADCSKYMSPDFCLRQLLLCDCFKYENFCERPDKATEYDVIIAPSGNGNWSDARCLLKRYLPTDKAVIIQVGWVQSTSPVGQLSNNAKVVRFGDDQVVVRARFESITRPFSGHADQQTLLKLIASLPNLKTVIITHGDEAARHGLETKIREMRPELLVYRPSYGTSIPLSKDGAKTPKGEAQVCQDIACVKADNAGPYLCQMSWVWGKVFEARRYKSAYGDVVFLNFSQVYPKQSFVVFIGSEIVVEQDKKHGKGWEKRYENSIVCVYGLVGWYRDKLGKEYPQIEIQEINQLQIIETRAPPLCPCR
ncbi:MAG: MBL fold metallo-hydrolase [Candidatus Bathyarchaeia archaeon]